MPEQKMKTRRELIAGLRFPTLPSNPPTFTEFRLLATKIDLIAEALAVILDEQRPKA